MAYEEYLIGVMNSKYFCPKHSDIRLLPLYTPPTKEVLLKKVQIIAEKKGWAMGFSDENKPDKAWLIYFLSTYDANDQIFHKSYVAPPIRKKKEEEKVH